MRQYTNSEQTAKLIELGLPKPTGSHNYWRVNELVINISYSIGELIEMLPKEINNDTLPDTLGIYIDHNKMWVVDYSCVMGAIYSTSSAELIDALYDMVMVLKEEGVI